MQINYDKNNWLFIKYKRWGLDDKQAVIKQAEDFLNAKGISTEIKMSYHLPVLSKFGKI